jgi:hypothetical protein
LVNLTHSTAAAFGVDALLGFITLVRARHVIANRTSRHRSTRFQELVEVRELIADRPRPEPLLAAWEHVAASLESVPKADDLLVARIMALEGASDSAVAHFRSVAEPHVNALNGLAARIDDNRVRPKSLVRLDPGLHEALLLEVHLIEPFVWYESIFRGRGRWGYRPADLRRILEALRPASRRPSTHAATQVRAGDLLVMDLEALSRPRRLWLATKLKIKSPTIDTKSKVKQRELRHKLEVDLERLGAQLPTPVGHRAIEW